MPGQASPKELVRLIDLPLVQPELTDDRMVEGLNLARRHQIACASVRPCDIDLAVRVLQGSGVRPGAVCGYPDGTPGTGTKLYEARDLLRRGAKEIDMVIAVPKLLSREFQYVQTELLQMAELCHKEGAMLKVIVDSSAFTDELKIIACRCAERAEADFVSTRDVALARKYLPDEVGVKAIGIETLEQAAAAIAAGATRIGTSAVEEIMDQFKVQP